MYKTIRMLPAALLLLLLGTACTNDLADSPAATGLPLVLENVYIGAQTKAEPYEPGFVDGSTLTATLTLGDVTTEGTYTYNGTTWTATTPAYWQNSTEKHTVTLHTPKPNPAMPTEGFSAANWHKYDILDYPATEVTPGTTSFDEVKHTRAQLIVTLTPGTGLEDADLSKATVQVDGCGMMAHKEAHYALIAPATSPALTISYDGETYTYKENIPLAANKCTHLTLALHKTGVSGISITSEDWQNVTASSQLEEGWTAIHCNGGNLTIPADATKLLITGTLTSSDMDIFYNAKDRITDLYITASAENDEVWEALYMSAQNLQSAYIAQATSIGKNAFSSCIKLTSISLPEATDIGKSAFFDCRELTSISLPAAINIGEDVFSECTKLTSISLPEATDIGENAFESHISSLTSISLPKATTIGDNAFNGCTKLTTLLISTPDATDVDAQEYADKISTLTTIHYGYKGTGDYLDPASYTAVWNRE